eukprot:TRINITY_DN53668_c0_g1_i1.p1 TRINITY_DN53668_c0_g1~~TRINITY_DN53668_c0_g1_i1.p1  ORF type:complete len:166 (+),score=41.10 TRINITY_DN53668_c0_g1_i1:115-612(+)
MQRGLVGSEMCIRDRYMGLKKMNDKEMMDCVRKVFVQVSNGKPEISRSQLRELLFLLGCKPLIKEIYFNEILQRADPKSTGKLTADKLVSALTDMMTPKSTEEEVKEALQVFDEDGSGKIVKGEIVRALTAYSSLPKDQVENLVEIKKPGDSILVKDLLSKLLGK